MSLFIWFVVGCLAMYVAWALFKVLLGGLVPIEKSARVLLRQEIKKYGVNTEGIPEKFFDESVSDAIKIARILNSKSKLKQRVEVVKSMEHMALMVSTWKTRPADSVLANRGSQTNFYRSLFERHGI